MERVCTLGSIRLPYSMFQLPVFANPVALTQARAYNGACQHASQRVRVHRDLSGEHGRVHSRRAEGEPDCTQARGRKTEQRHCTDEGLIYVIRVSAFKSKLFLIRCSWQWYLFNYRSRQEHQVWSIDSLILSTILDGNQATSNQQASRCVSPPNTRKQSRTAAAHNACLASRAALCFWTQNRTTCPPPPDPTNLA